LDIDNSMYNNSGYESMPLAARFNFVLFCRPLGRTENASWSYLVLRLCNYSAKGGINSVDVALYSQDLRRPRNMLFSMLSHAVESAIDPRIIIITAKVVAFIVSSIKRII